MNLDYWRFEYYNKTKIQENLEIHEEIMRKEFFDKFLSYFKQI